MKLIITIDTEADNQWAREETATLRNIDYIPRFQALCDAYDIKPTYLATHAMALSDNFVQTVGPYQEAGRAEIGAHLHPWNTPPLYALTDDDHRHHPFPHEYPRQTLREKLTVLTETLEARVGQRPITFRAGRYGFDAVVAALLLELGYWADCSVTPLVSWRRTPGDPRGHGGPDFAATPPYAYVTSRADVTRPGDSGLLEVPVSIFFVRWPVLNRFIRSLKRLYADRHDFVLRSLYQLGQKPVWFRPHPKYSAQHMLTIYQIARRLQLDYVEMMFHSSELMPGGSKNTPDSGTIEALYRLFEEIFAGLRTAGVQSMTLADYARAHRKRTA